MKYALGINLGLRTCCAPPTESSVFSSAPADTTPPAVEIVGGDHDSINAEVLTYEDGGTVFWMLTESSSPPDAAGIIAGVHPLYIAHGSINAPTAGTQSVSVNSLTPETTYWLYAIHQDAALNNSDVASDDDTTLPDPS
jgi:hypothetical protein